LVGVRQMNPHYNCMHNIRRFGLCSLVCFLSMSARAIDLVSFQSVHDFKRSASDGEYLNEPITEGSDGLLYGAAVNGGGPDDGGIVFRMEKSGSNYQILHVFGLSTTNGDSPWGGVIEGKDGKLYGATRHGGAEDAGIIYSLAKDGGDFKIVYSFSTNGNAGRFPMNSVIQTRDGRLYGKTISGGEGDGVTIFGVNTDGSGFQSLHSFEHSVNDHYIAYSGLMEGSDGMLYGTTSAEGPDRGGSVFRINKDGSAFQTLHFFNAAAGSSGGYVPDGGVTETSDGVLFGTTEGGGFDDFGVLYRINRDGADYKILHEFTAKNDAGYTPSSPPIEGADGALYGTTYFGGPEDTGAIYRINKDGSGLTFLYTFLGTNCPAYPYASLKILSDGGFYGTTFNGLGEVYGAVFRINVVSLTLTGTSIHVNGMFGQDYAVDGKDNVEDPWQEIARFTNLVGTDPFPVVKSKARQFFRARTIAP
jgi:uncharacterized repeat protein (TIGR03803 family)